MKSGMKLLATDGAADDRFGVSVAIYGDTIVVGARGDDEYSGSAHVFVQRSGKNWKHQAKLLAPDGAEKYQFVHEDTIVVGAPYDNDNWSSSGSTHVVVRSGEEWRHQAKLQAPDGAADDYFGRGVTIYQDTIVVGAHYDDDNGDASGSARVFVRSGKKWTHQAKLLAPNGAADDEFGDSVAIYDNRIVAGARRDDDNGADSGSAHVFVRSGEEWTHQAKLLAPDGAALDQFGTSVAIHEDTTVVGARGDDDNGSESGSAYAYDVQG